MMNIMQQDGTIIVNTILKGHYVRTLRPPCDPAAPLAIPCIAISEEGQIIIHLRQPAASKHMQVCEDVSAPPPPPKKQRYHYILYYDYSNWHTPFKKVMQQDFDQLYFFNYRFIFVMLDFTWKPVYLPNINP